MRVSDERFREFLTTPTTTIHALTTDENDFGEFLFVTLSRLANKARIFMTFYGLGYHDYRERWIMRDWFWHQATATPELRKKRIPVETALAQIIARIDDITPNLRRNAPVKAQIITTSQTQPCAPQPQRVWLVAPLTG